MQKKFLTLTIFLAFVAFAGGFEMGKSRSREVVEITGGDEVAELSILQSSKVGEKLNVQIFDEVWKTAEKKFVDVEKLNPEKMLYGAMKGVIASFGDPHSEFLDPAESEEFLDSLEGDLTGIGAEVGMRDEILTIISPLRGSPAEKAGLLPGDKVFKIGGEIASDFSLFEAVKHIRGEPGTEIILTIFRGEETHSREIRITRDFIEIESVISEMRDDGIVVVTVATFADDTAEEFEEVLADLAIQNPKGMILDLRFNGGGFLDAAIEITSKLLESGEVVRIHERGKTDQIILVSGAPLLPQIPLVVLINEGSASSSEIVAGALQDSGRATIIGEKSFGKGTVQELISNFSDGSTLRITVAKWFTPSGRDVNEEGIQPDIVVKMELEDYFSDNDPQLDAAAEFLETGKVENAEVEEKEDES
ncbi:S41 family peptidase [Candidatus Gracilibacteria bacterium]|nr:S41 family peptidase [Candidatus Gracilibacteria bacterium]